MIFHLKEQPWGGPQGCFVRFSKMSVVPETLAVLHFIFLIYGKALPAKFASTERPVRMSGAGSSVEAV